MTEPGDSFEDRLRAGLTYGADGAPSAAGLAAGARTRAGVRRRRRIAVGAAVAVALVAVPAAVLAGGDGGRRAEDPGPAGPGDLLGDVEVTCGPDSGHWPVSVMDGGVPSPSIDEGRVRDAFLAAFEDDSVEAPEAIRREGVDAASYIVLAEDATGSTLGVGEWTTDGPGADGDWVRIEPGPGGSGGVSWGDCILERALPDGRSRVAVVAPAGGVDPTATEITVLVNELQCAGGRSVLPHLGEPEVLADDEQVIVTLTSDQIEGAATCQAREPEEHTLHLDEPIGDRELRDGGTWPPTPIEVASQTAILDPEEPMDRFVHAGVSGWVPTDWAERDCGGLAQFKPSTDCSPLTEGLHFLRRSSYQPAMAEGELVRSDESGETLWAGYVTVGRWAILAVTPKKAETRRILGTVGPA